ncbi:MAG: ABC transporter ATP-binding protein/permease [Alphaproteobacteria bacterium]|nr:ABC transporter ATP-binding protein/permease [Alphaproteobacteria bacterium]
MKGLAAAVISAEQVLRPRFRLRLRDRRSAATTEPAPAPATDLEPTIYRFILKHSLRQQIVLLLLTCASFPFLYFSLSLPKSIVNQAIRSDAPPHHQIFGIDFDRVPYLVVLCMGFLALVLINGAFKYCINTYKGQLGERMLRRFRYQLYQRLLRFPLNYFQKTSTAQIIPMITAECESLGGFIGDAFAIPAFQGGTLITIVLFMFMQDPVLGAAAVALYPMQGYVIPKLQRKVNALGKRRVRTIREVADRVHESAAGIIEIRAHDTVRLYLADFAHLMGTIYDIRFEIYRRKFFVKFLNNFIAQLTPFFFYLIGGYLVIAGDLSFGALVAVLAAYKDMASPWKELLDFYQQKEDSRIKYEQIVEQFQPAGLFDAALLLEEPENIPRLTGEIVVSNLSFEDEQSRSVDGVSFTAALDEHIAIIGQSGSGKTELGQVLARLVEPSGGRIMIGGFSLGDLALPVIGRRIGYAGAIPHLFPGSLRDNMLLALRHRPLRPPHYDDATGRRRARQIDEARRSGNIDFDLQADWIDYDAAGVDTPKALSQRIAEILRQLNFEDDVYSFGLRWRIDPRADPELTERLLRARTALAERLVTDGITQLVETYDVERYNTNASVAENLLFGTPIGPVFDFEALAENSYVLSVLDKVGLTTDLLNIGRQVAAMMTEMFGGLAPEHEFFEQFCFINAPDLPIFAAILTAIDGGGVDALRQDQKHKLLSLPLKLIVARHRLDFLDETMQQRILEARQVFRRDLPEKYSDQIEFFDPKRYNAAASLQDNILMGRIAFGEADAPLRIPELLAEIVDAVDLRPAIVDVGLEYNVGTSGARLSQAQRQQVAIAAALLKKPDLLILNEATSALDAQAQAKVADGLRQEMAGRGMVWVLHRASLARNFDRVMVMSGGKLQEQGRFEELNRNDSLTALLMAAE